MTVSLSLVQGAYIVAGLLFIMALAGLSKHETAPAGNRYGIVGMTVALVITILAAVLGVETANGAVQTEGAGLSGFALIVAAMAIGGAIGIWRAKRVEMTGMPELIAMLHSFVGLAAVLVGWNSSYETDVLYPSIHDVEVFVGVFIGAVTFTGSIVAYLKLSAKIKSAPLMLPAHNAINLGHHRRFLRDDRCVRDRPLRRDRPAPVAAWHHDPAGAVPRLAPRGLHRRRRHACRGLDAQQLLRLGSGRCGLPAQQRPAHHHGRPCGLLGCVPVLHHVSGDEPLVHLGHRRRVRRGGRHGGLRRRLRRAPGDHS